MGGGGELGNCQGILLRSNCGHPVVGTHCTFILMCTVCIVKKLSSSLTNHCKLCILTIYASSEMPAVFMNVRLMLECRTGNREALSLNSTSAGLCF